MGKGEGGRMADMNHPLETFEGAQAKERAEEEADRLRGLARSWGFDVEARTVMVTARTYGGQVHASASKARNDPPDRPPEAKRTPALRASGPRMHFPPRLKPKPGIPTQDQRMAVSPAPPFPPARVHASRHLPVASRGESAAPTLCWRCWRRRVRTQRPRGHPLPLLRTRRPTDQRRLPYTRRCIWYAGRIGKVIHEDI